MMNELGSERTEEPRTTRLDGVSTWLVQAVSAPVHVMLFLAFTGFAVIAQPYGSYGDMPVLPRCAYWAVIVGGAILATLLFDMVARRMTPSGNPLRIGALSVLFAAVAFSPLVILWNALFVPWYPGLDARPIRIAFDVTVTAIAVFSVLGVFRSRYIPEVFAHQYDGVGGTTPGAERPRLAARLERPDVRIIRLSANDHLIDVVSNEGVEQIRLRFADAVREMEPIEGCCVHRSHWIARDTAVELLRRKGKLFVKLSNGEDIPVSRTYRPDLEAMRPDLF